MMSFEAIINNMTQQELDQFLAAAKIAQTSLPQVFPTTAKDLTEAIQKNPVDHVLFMHMLRCANARQAALEEENRQQRMHQIDEVQRKQLDSILHGPELASFYKRWEGVRAKLEELRTFLKNIQIYIDIDVTYVPKVNSTWTPVNLMLSPSTSLPYDEIYNALDISGVELRIKDVDSNLPINTADSVDSVSASLSIGLDDLSGQLSSVFPQVASFCKQWEKEVRELHKEYYSFYNMYHLSEALLLEPLADLRRDNAIVAVLDFS